MHGIEFYRAPQARERFLEFSLAEQNHAEVGGTWRMVRFQRQGLAKQGLRLREVSALPHGDAFFIDPGGIRCRAWEELAVPASQHDPESGRGPVQLPAMVMFSSRIDPQSREPRTRRSFPMATMDLNMSRRLPAMVISSTGY